MASSLNALHMEASGAIQNSEDNALVSMDEKVEDIEKHCFFGIEIVIAIGIGTGFDSDPDFEV